MELEDNNRNFLDQLYRDTKGDTSAKVSMYEIGAAMGLEKSEAGSLAESLIVDGLVELKTLAGGIGITEEGIAALGYGPPAAAESRETTPSISLGQGPVATEQDRQTVSELVRRVKASISGSNLAYDILEEIVIDLKTIDVQLLSPKPKTAVLLALFRSLQATLAAAGVTETAAMLESVT